MTNSLLHEVTYVTAREQILCVFDSTIATLWIFPCLEENMSQAIGNVSIGRLEMRGDLTDLEHVDGLGIRESMAPC